MEVVLFVIFLVVLITKVSQVKDKRKIECTNWLFFCLFIVSFSLRLSLPIITLSGKVTDNVRRFIESTHFFTDAFAELWIISFTFEAHLIHTKMLSLRFDAFD